MVYDDRRGLVRRDRSSRHIKRLSIIPEKIWIRGLGRCPEVRLAEIAARIEVGKVTGAILADVQLSRREIFILLKSLLNNLFSDFFWVPEQRGCDAGNEGN